ncbi:uncharacterized protein LOC131958392 [Physella acuta]|uniref:uncharacterized protein LOC131958392 n=1 Tax=Physella acuta TaxID=109671 RepID=UPI0027DE0992|nr:uncharacterized protein LOC131958392 [Physella acuta]
MLYVLKSLCKLFVVLLLQVHLQLCVDVEEFADATLTCNALSLVQYSQLTWYQNTIRKCSCYWNGSTGYCSCVAQKYTSNITNGLSYLTIQNSTLNDFGLWRCEVSPTYTEYSDLVVVARASGVKCDTGFSVDFRLLVLTCVTEKIFPSAVCTFQKNTPFYSYPTTYNHTKDSNGYYKSTCTVRAPMNRLTPGRVNISADMFPSESSTQYAVSTLSYIELTYPEPMLTNCPSSDKIANNSFIKFGTNATCTCTTKQTGNPPVKAYWNGTMSDNASGVLVIDTLNSDTHFVLLRNVILFLNETVLIMC